MTRPFAAKTAVLQVKVWKFLGRLASSLPTSNQAERVVPVERCEGAGLTLAKAGKH